MRVLLVDDSDSVEAYVRKIVEAEGWTLDRARGGMEAMTRALAGRPDVILLDFVMPDMDGLELLKLLFTADVRAPSVVLSGAESPDVMRRFAAAGAADYLAKEDLTPPRLRQAIRMAAEMGEAPPPRARPSVRGAPSEGADEDPPAVDPAGAVVLLVDDTTTFRAMLRKPLAERGWVVLEAADAKHAIAQAVSLRPDVILLDHVLPDDEGLAVLRAVREHGLEARVVAFTGHGDEALAEAFLREGAVDYLSKDTSVTRVLATLERALWLGGARLAVRPVTRR